MAELGVAIATAVLTLGEFLHKHSNFLFGIRENIEWLKDELRSMQSFLEAAEKKLDNNDETIEVWVSDVRNLAFECEDVINTFLLQLSFMQEPQPSCMGTMSRCFVAYTAQFPSTVDLGCKIENLKTRATDISNRRERYRLDFTDVSTTSDSRRRKIMQIRISASYDKEEHMVGLGETISLLKGKLTEGGSGRFVISIHGMGGLGKTTLARKLFNSLSRKYFESSYWVCVSQEYNTRDILLDLIKSKVKPEPTKEDLERMTTQQSMEEYLRDRLSGRRYLVVIDDVWETVAWESLCRAFPDSNKSSRVIITTRNKHVATLNTAYVHELRYLQEDESWELFCKKAFQYDGMICPPNLEEIGRKMVTKCAGLPLAIITLGGLLSTKSSFLSEWESVRDNLWKELEKNNSVHINAVLQLSYKDLPQNLKPCFLYVGMFPEDFEIPISKLILMWVAEGFIGQEEEGSPEDIAKSYFNELVGRSLIQKKGDDWIYPNTCRVHDLLRDMSIRKAKEMCFSLYYDGKTTSILSKPHRRLTHVTCDNIPSSYNNPSLRTFFQWTTKTDSHLGFECFSLLRVLDIQAYRSSGIRVFKIPGEIGSLIHLRYLSLSHNYDEVKFPKTISNLKALETLSLSDGEGTLPKTIVKLKNLRHLIAKCHSTGDWIGELIGLETLEDVSYDQWRRIDTTRLVNLRHLCVHSIPSNPTRFYDKFQNLTRLQTLKLSALGCRISASEIFKRCPSITHFVSYGMSYNQSADLHEFAVNLQVLEMILEDLRHDPIPSIKKLPKLRALQISITFDIGDRRGKLVFSDGGFTHLRTLKIKTCGSCQFVVEEGSLPSLTHLEVNKPDLIIVPDTMKQLIIKTY